MRSVAGRNTLLGGRGRSPSTPIVQSLEKPASPLLEAQRFCYATSIKDSTRMSNYVRSSAQYGTRDSANAAVKLL